MSEAKRVALKLAAEFRQGDQAPSQVTVSVEGQGELAEQVALAVSERFQQLLRDHAQPLPARPMQAVGAEAAAQMAVSEAEHVSPVERVQALDWTPAERSDATDAAPGTPAAARTVSDSTATPQHASALTPPSEPWFKRHRARITMWTGLVLLALAVTIPLLAPPALRREIWPMPVAFGLSGALCLMSALLPERGRAAAGRDVREAARHAPAQASAGAAAQDARRIAQLARPGIAQRMGGLIFGLALALGGLLAPFVLPGGPDERFLMMLGFAPVAAIGLLLLWIFARRSMRGQLEVVGGAEAALARQHSGFQAYAPTVIVGLVLLLGSVLIVVIVATLLPLLKR